MLIDHTVCIQATNVPLPCYGSFYSRHNSVSSARSVLSLEFKSIGSSPYLAGLFLTSHKILFHSEEGRASARGDADFTLDVLNMVIYRLI